MSTEIQTLDDAPLPAQLEARSLQFAAALPKHIPLERFKRVVMTAVQMNPALAGADRRSFWNAAMKAAQDGLLPDGREGALVIYKTKVKRGDREIYIDAVQWMPMIAGIRKKVRNSTEISTWEVHCVYAKDRFAYRLGDDPHIDHEPYTGDDDPGQIVAAYSVAKLKDGSISREVMTRREIEKVRLISKAKDSGPWSQWYGEMARKTVARRHSKVLPMSTDLDDLIRRDDALYDFESKKELPAPGAPRPRLQDFTVQQEGNEIEESAQPASADDGKAAASRETSAAAGPNPILDEARAVARKGRAAFDQWWKRTNASQREIVNSISEELFALAVAADKKPSESPAPGEAAADESVPAASTTAEAHALGRAARDKKFALAAVPPEFREPPMQKFAEAWQDGWRERDAELMKP